MPADQKIVNYYQEDPTQRGKVAPIDNQTQKNKIDYYYRKYGKFPAGFSRENGYRKLTLAIHADKIQINDKLIKKKSSTSSATIISKLKEKTIALPVSCMGSTEHIVAMENQVTHFVSEFRPKSKKDVYYQIKLEYEDDALSATDKIENIGISIQDKDSQIDPSDWNIHHIKDNHFILEASTQQCDIELILSALTQLPNITILPCEFNNIHLNEGLCLVSKKSEESIHAIVNIADTEKEGKVFLERNAGAMTGNSLSKYQDTKWVFRFFNDMPSLKASYGFDQSDYVIKIVKKS